MVKRIFIVIALFVLQMEKLPAVPSEEAQRHKQIPLQQEIIMKQDMLRHHRWSAALSRGRSEQISALQEGYDVLHYDIDLDIDPILEVISGTVTAKCSLLTLPTTSLAFNLYDSMTVSDARTNGASAAFIHAGNIITIDIGDSLSPGDTVNVAIDYSGKPDSVGRYGPFQFKTHGDNSAPAIFSISTPDYASTWWPCKDVVDDKTTADIRITVPDTLVVASNGLLMNIVDLGNGKHRYDWKESYPISTYLISVAISDYTVDSSYYHYGTMDSMKVMYFIFPEDYDKAKEDFNVTVSMIEFFSSIFGPYPFLTEKYAMAEASWGSLGMEHQTCTTYGQGFVRGDHRNDRIIAHELSHQWWGDFVSVGDWRDIWLNEGFATYAEALWMEHTEGFQAYRDFMADRSYDDGFPGSIYDPEDLFNITVYWKGAWVLHMLRHVIGDAAFFTALNNYGSSHAYGNAVTPDFQEACESAYGSDLSWFFDQWVYGTSRPHYAYSWMQYALGDVRYVNLDVEQIQSSGALFNMPLDVRLYRAGWDSTIVVSTTSKEHRFTFEVPGLIDSLALDPDGWILKHLDFNGGANNLGRLSLLFTTYPNPFNPKSDMRIALHIPWAGNVEVAVFDVSGALVKTVYKGWLGKGPCELSWNGKDDSGTPMSSGMYFIRISAPQGSYTRKALLIK